jgi:hypothetical protein
MAWITGDAGELINLSRITKIDVVPNDDDGPGFVVRAYVSLEQGLDEGSALSYGTQEQCGAFLDRLALLPSVSHPPRFRPMRLTGPQMWKSNVQSTAG